MKFLNAWREAADPVPKRLPAKAVAYAGAGGFLATAAFAGAGAAAQMPLELGSFGASCLLVFAYPASPFSQPRNVIGGHFTATLTGLAVMAVCGAHWWSMALGVALAVMLMLLLRVPHPPAGSNPLIVMLGAAGWDFLWTPTLFGSLILVGVALFFNNLGDGRKYPLYW